MKNDFLAEYKPSVRRRESITSRLLRWVHRNDSFVHLSEHIDGRAVQTQRLLYRALVSLIVERGWYQVSVQDVCDCAAVERATFDLYFRNKEELLLIGFDLF